MFSSQHPDRQPAVADQFYPANPQLLRDMLDKSLAKARASSDIKGYIKALIVPHAGYIYSADIAANAYHLIAQQAPQIKRVVLLGPSHRVGFQGIATCSARAYNMPFGQVILDQQSLDRLRALPQVQTLDQAHLKEHSLEVQLPFLQRLLTDFMLIPLVVGDCEADLVAEVLEQVWGGHETLIVISSDLSHYLNYQQAQQLDQETASAIVRLDYQHVGYEQACGRNPVNGLLRQARVHDLEARVVDLRNSGDTAGHHDRVVGYGAFVFSEITDTRPDYV